jgi:hypothetical protein
MNKLTKYILVGLAIAIALIISFQFNLLGVPKPANNHFLLILASRTLLIMFAGFYILDIGLDIRDLVNIKYRIVKPPEYKYIWEAEYLTLNALFIPVWKPVKYKIETYETQNVFGATFTNYYDSDERFSSEEEAIKEIEKHKVEWTKNRQEWLVKKSKEKPIVKYL